MRCMQQLRLLARQFEPSACASAKHFSAASRFGDGDLKGTAAIPANEYERKAIIYKPGGPAAQYGYDEKAMNGGAHTPVKIWLPTQEMWANPLMGWTSSSDVAESSFRKMDFDTVEAAQEFLRKQGIRFTVEEAPTNWDPTYRPKCFQGYGDNFSTTKKGIPDLSHLPSNRPAKSTGASGKSPPKKK